MVNHYKNLGLKKVINASGRMTALGVSTFSDKAANAMKFAGQNYVKIDQLVRKSGEKVAELLGSEEALIVSSASAGISMVVAALIHKGKRLYIQKPLEAVTEYNAPNEIIVLKGHNVNYGAPVETMIQAAGGKVIEAGWANKCDLNDIETVINEKTVGIMFVKSHHCVQKSMPKLEEVAEFAKRQNIPFLADIAAEEDLKKYGTNKNIDFAIISGAKAIEGPTSGIVACKKKYISWLRDEVYGIGRSMKIGKENIIGQVAALADYLENAKSTWNNELLLTLIKEINNIEDLKCEVEVEEARNISRAKIIVDNNKFSAKDVVEKLEGGEVIIVGRKHRVNEGIIYLDPRPLKDEDYNMIINRLKEIRRELNA